VISENNSIKVWNKAASETFGIELSERLNDFNPIFGNENMDEFQQILDHFRRKNNTYSYETTRQRKDGLVIDLQVWVSKISKSTEGGFQFLLMFEDSTERKKNINKITELNRNLEQRVRERTIQYEELNTLLKEENESRLKSENAIKKFALEVEDLYNNAPCGYHSLDAQGIYKRINDTELEWLGFRREEVIDKKNFKEFLTEESKKTFAENFPKVQTEGAIGELEFDLIDRNGNVMTVLLSSSAIVDENNKFVMTRSTLFDISDLKVSQKKIEELNKSLIERANQLELVNKELESFTYSVSHDLKSPLRSIQGFTDIILSDHSQELSEETLRLFNVIRKNAMRMDMLIQDLLNLAKVTRSELKLVPLDMEKIISNIIENDFANLDSNKVKIEVSDLYKSKGDVVLIQQVWLNLLSNAIKYSRNEETTLIKIESKQSGKCVQYSISDNGVGFNPSYKHKLFGTFQRLHSNNEFEGTGVGLAIVKRIINRHGGDVWADSQEGEGATFYFTLPPV
jgi:PAS domain S-box-containing protein